MAISEEEIKLILNTQDSSTQVHALATEVEFLTGRMERLAKEFNDGILTEKQYVALSQDTGRELRERASLTEEVARATGVLEKSHRDLGQTMLQGSYALQDFTSQLGTRGLAGGLAAVQNNIPGILQGLGAGAGLAGTISVLSVALGAALPHIQAFFGAMDPEKAKAAADELKKVEQGAAALLTAPRDEPGKAMAAALGQYEQRGQEIGGAVYEALNVRDRAVPTAEEKSAVQVYGMTAGPGRWAAQALGIAMSPEALQEQLTKRTRQEASRLIDASATPGAAGKAARDRLKKLAKASPNLFPNDFADFLDSVEETPGEVALAEAKIEDEDPDAQQHAKRAAGIERRNQALEEEQAAQKRADRIAATYVDDALINEAEKKKINDARAKAARDAAAAKKKADREHAAAEKAAARAADPNIAARAEGELLEDQARAMAQDMEGPMGWQPNRTQYEAMIHQAVGGMPQGGGQAELFEAIQRAAWAGYQKSQDDQRKLYERMNQGTESRLRN